MQDREPTWKPAKADLAFSLNIAYGVLNYLLLRDNAKCCMKFNWFEFDGHEGPQVQLGFDILCLQKYYATSSACVIIISKILLMIMLVFVNYSHFSKKNTEIVHLLFTVEALLGGGVGLVIPYPLKFPRSSNSYPYNY